MPETARKKLPPLQIGVSEFGNIRMLKMVRPVCPTASFPDQDGYDPYVLNCQREFNGRRGWQEKCEERGHKPYFRKVAGGEVPNTVQVALNERINGGDGYARARRKGYKLLEEVGYDPVCEYRNCELPVKVKSIYGNYCTERHARLIGADVEKIELEVHPDRRGEREKQLRQISIYDGNV